MNSFGEIVADQWRWLHEQYLYLTMDEFVVMPNHFHGIVNISDIVRDSAVGNGRDRSPHTDDGPQKIKSLSELMGAFKTTSSKHIHQRGLPFFQWQKSFYERIIRNDHELLRIREYIQTNPLRWETDIENNWDSPGVGNGRDRSLQRESVQDYYDKIIATVRPESNVIA